MIDPNDYLEFVEREYLGSFIASGGASVKFLVADGLSEDQWYSRLRDAAWNRGYVIVRVGAAHVKVQAIEQVFFEIARQVDWADLSARCLRRAYEGLRMPPAGERELSLRAVAEHHSYDPGELRRELNLHLQHEILRDYAMTQEFRVAMLRLAQHGADTGDVTDAEAAALRDWLTGELRRITLLKSVGIYQKIARHNARDLLFSLTHWLHTNGITGLVVDLDIRRLAAARPKALEERSGFYYTKATAMDAYEMLRQLIDNTDDLQHCLVSVYCAPEFLADPARGIDSYNALKLRIYNDVHDRERDNPYSSLVRLGVSA